MANRSPSSVPSRETRPSVPPSRCGHCAADHTGELPCWATATTKARAWLLIEHPGPWPERIEQLTEPGPVAAAIREAARLGVRPQLIRRTGRRRATPPTRVYVGRSEGPDLWLEGRVLDDPAELAELDLAQVAAGARPRFGAAVREPLLLVCTHGRRNVCCASTGAPLARRLSTTYGDMVWETSHLGGDRFAANLACLPHGLYYGQLDGASAVAAAEAYLRGEVVLDRLRGRAGLPEPVQAAEHLARVHTGELRIDAVAVESVTGGAPYEAVVRVGGRRLAMVFERIRATGHCAPGCDEKHNTYRVQGVSLLNPVGLV